MKKCLVCDSPTTGSVGAAGIKWPFICQKCKDEEDKALENRIKYVTYLYREDVEPYVRSWRKQW